MMPLETDYFPLFFSFLLCAFLPVMDFTLSSHSRALPVAMSLALLLSLGVT
jgi:hypothetical protein